MIQLACTHCHHRFEAEIKEGSVCPSCGWSSSVVLASEAEAPKSKIESRTKTPVTPGFVPGFLKFSLKALILIAILVILVWAVTHLLKSLKKSPSKPHQKTNIALPADSQNVIKPVAASDLSAQDKDILSSELNVSEEVELSDDDLRQLQKAVDFSSAEVQKLPSASWTSEEFKQFIEKQEQAFKMPLPRGYKKDLEELFKKTYAGAYDLFLTGKIQQARDAYVASLGFPVYMNDVRKQRAVVLTMMRPFINDTIAKIGAMNFTLARAQVGGQTAQVVTAYAALQQMIRNREWSQALVAADKLASELPDVAAALPVIQAPPYTTGFEKVDADIQGTLLRLLAVPTLGFDAQVLGSDLSVKKELLLELADPDRKKSVESYRAALLKIESKEWPEARRLLLEVKSPAELKEDADQKISVLNKIAQAAVTTTK